MQHLQRIPGILSVLLALVAPLRAEDIERRIEDAAALMANDPNGGGEQLKAIETELRQAIASEPDDAQLHYLLGRTLMHTGRSEEALQRMSRTLELDDKHVGAWFYTGTLRNRFEDEASALEAYRKAAELEPTFLNAHYNVGQTCQNLGRFEESIAAYETVLKLDPDDWRARAKVIQNLQALQRTEEVAKWRTKLFEQRRAGTIPAKFYCREQFRVGDNRVTAFEYFELEGDWAMRYSFQVTPPGAMKSAYRISLGSYPATTEHARASGQIAADQRLFHLDGYYENGRVHRTFGFFRNEPTYDETRRMVTEIIEGKRKAISSMTAPTTRPKK